MPRMKLTLEAIEGGNMMEIANEKLEELCNDLVQRSELNEPRTLTIEVKIAPHLKPVAGGRVLNLPGVDWKIKTSKPGAKGMTTRAFVDDQTKTVMVNTDDPMCDNPDQTTIFEVASQ